MEEMPDELIPDEPEELLGNRVDYLVQINKALDLPSNFCRDSYVEYSLFLSEEKHKTNVVEGKDRNPLFNYSKHHT